MPRDTTPTSYHGFGRPEVWADWTAAWDYLVQTVDANLLKTGPIADRPTSPPTGSWYYATDDAVLYRYTDVGTWVAIAGTSAFNHQNLTNNPHSVTASQAGALPIEGGTLTGSLTVNGQRVNLPNASGNEGLQFSDGNGLSVYQGYLTAYTSAAGSQGFRVRNPSGLGDLLTVDKATGNVTTPGSLTTGGVISAGDAVSTPKVNITVDTGDAMSFKSAAGSTGTYHTVRYDNRDVRFYAGNAAATALALTQGGNVSVGGDLVGGVDIRDQVNFTDSAGTNQFIISENETYDGVAGHYLATYAGAHLPWILRTSATNTLVADAGDVSIPNGDLTVSGDVTASGGMAANAGKTHVAHPMVDTAGVGEPQIILLGRSSAGALDNYRGNIQGRIRGDAAGSDHRGRLLIDVVASTGSDSYGAMFNYRAQSSHGQFDVSPVTCTFNGNNYLGIRLSGTTANWYPVEYTFTGEVTEADGANRGEVLRVVPETAVTNIAAATTPQTPETWNHASQTNFSGAVDVGGNLNVTGNLVNPKTTGQTTFRGTFADGDRVAHFDVWRSYSIRRRGLADGSADLSIESDVGNNDILIGSTSTGSYVRTAEFTTSNNVLIPNGSLTVAGDITTGGASVATDADLSAHTSNTTNPHSVTASQTGAVPTTGGELTGNLTINKDPSNYWYAQHECTNFISGSDRYVVLLEPLNGTADDRTNGTFRMHRGNSGASSAAASVEVLTKENDDVGSEHAGMISVSSVDDTSATDFRLVTCNYNATTYLALDYNVTTTNKTHTDGVYFTGVSVSTGAEHLTVVPYYANGSTPTIKNQEIYDSITPWSSHLPTLRKISASKVDVDGDLQKQGQTVAVDADLDAHTASTTNPHSVTASQTGAVPTTGATMTGPITWTPANRPALQYNEAATTGNSQNALFEFYQSGSGARAGFFGYRTSGGKVGTANRLHFTNQLDGTEFDILSGNAYVDGTALTKSSELSAHTSNTTNPHSVTASQAGAVPSTGGTVTGDLNVQGKTTTDTVEQTGGGQLSNAGNHVTAGAPVQGSEHASAGWGTRFNITEDVHIADCWVQSAQGGPVDVHVYRWNDATNSVIGSPIVTRSPTAVGGNSPERLELDFTLPPNNAGESYLICRANTTGLYRNTSPQSIRDVPFMSYISGANSNGSTNSGYYYFFDFGVSAASALKDVSPTPNGIRVEGDMDVTGKTTGGGMSVVDTASDTDPATPLSINLTVPDPTEYSHYEIKGIVHGKGPAGAGAETDMTITFDNYTASIYDYTLMSQGVTSWHPNQPGMVEKLWSRYKTPIDYTIAADSIPDQGVDDETAFITLNSNSHSGRRGLLGGRTGSVTSSGGHPEATVSSIQMSTATDPFVADLTLYGLDFRDEI